MCVIIKVDLLGARSGTRRRGSLKYRKTEDLLDFENRFPDRGGKMGFRPISRRSSLIGNYRHSRINKPVYLAMPKITKIERRNSLCVAGCDTATTTGQEGKKRKETGEESSGCTRWKNFISTR